MRELVKKIVLQYINRDKFKPTKISLRLLWDKNSSLITIDEKKTIEIPEIISFSSFADGVINAFREVYGELELIPVDLRSDIYQNNRVTLELYPTGSLSRFDIYIQYH